MNRRRLLAGAAALAVAPVAPAPAAAASAPFEAWLLGTGSPEPDVERFGPATLVRCGDQHLIFDAGRGLTMRLSQLFGKMFSRRAGATTFAALDKVFLTHLHSDHVVGLPDLFLTGWADRLDRPLRLWGPAGTRALADGLVAAFGFDIHVRRDLGQRFPGRGATFDVREGGSGVVYREGGVEVSAFTVDHATVAPALGYQVAFGGRRLVISGDTRPTEAVVRAARGADVLIHEVMEAPADLIERPPLAGIRRHHTTGAELAGVLSAARPRLALAHHLLLFGGVTEADLVREVGARYPGTFLAARDLDHVVIGPDHVAVARGGTEILRVPRGEREAGGA